MLHCKAPDTPAPQPLGGQQPTFDSGHGKPHLLTLLGGSSHDHARRSLQPKLVAEHV